MMNFSVQDIIKYFQNKWVGWLITFGAIIIISYDDWFVIFDTME